MRERGGHCKVGFRAEEATSDAESRRRHAFHGSVVARIANPTYNSEHLFPLFKHSSTNDIRALTRKNLSGSVGLMRMIAAS